MSKSPEDRPRSAEAFIDELEAAVAAIDLDGPTGGATLLDGSPALQTAVDPPLDRDAPDTVIDEVPDDEPPPASRPSGYLWVTMGTVAVCIATAVAIVLAVVGSTPAEIPAAPEASPAVRSAAPVSDEAKAAVLDAVRTAEGAEASAESNAEPGQVGPRGDENVAPSSGGAAKPRKAQTPPAQTPPGPRKTAPKPHKPKETSPYEPVE